MIIKAIIMLSMATTFSINVNAEKKNQTLKATDSCANASMENVDIRLLKSNSEYYILAVSMNNETTDYSLSFLNGQNDVLYSAILAKQFSKKYAINKNDDFEGLKIKITNNKCNTSQYYVLSFVSKSTDALLVMKD